MQNLELFVNSHAATVRNVGLGDFAIFVPQTTAGYTANPGSGDNTSTATAFVCYGLGSCVALILADPGTRILAMAHVVLPHPPGDIPVPPLTRYATSAPSFLVERMVARGARQDRLVAWLVGGAQVLALKQTEPIGTRNVEVLRQELHRMGIPVIGEAVGGTFGRTLYCYPQRGLLVVSRGGQRHEVLHDGSLFGL
ncbi:MAG: chemotaxis protein CheD [Limnochordales bacterium]|nr:chemotaxis protein CheD [Limnochordales bacterium]